ncbi:MAG: glycosyltransferase family 2 protein, partial [Microcoleaceae cyanobacterium]
KELYRQQQPVSGEILPPMGFQLMESVNPYDVWLQMNQWGDRNQQHLINRLSQYKKEQLPKISVIMPVYNPPVEFLRQAIQSVLNQVYENWELCIADDCSTLPEVKETLLTWQNTDPRIQVVFRTENGNISAATNTAASLATGDYLLFLDNDDELTVNALGEVALYIAENPQADFIYSDDDKIDTDGKRFDPQFKPDWSPELLLSYMYLGHVCVVKQTIFEKIGGLRIGFEGSQDYDFALRATEIARSVGHIPLVLYHWRTAPGSTAISGGQKPESFMAGKQAVQDAFDRRQVNASVVQPDWAIAENLGIFQPKFPDQGPLVTIIIPTKNQYDLLKGC